MINKDFRRSNTRGGVRNSTQSTSGAGLINLS